MEDVAVIDDYLGGVPPQHDAAGAERRSLRRRAPSPSVPPIGDNANTLSEDCRRGKRPRSLHQAEPARADVRSGAASDLATGDQGIQEEQVPRDHPAPT